MRVDPAKNSRQESMAAINTNEAPKVTLDVSALQKQSSKAKVQAEDGYTDLKSSTSPREGRKEKQQSVLNLETTTNTGYADIQVI